MRTPADLPRRLPRSSRRFRLGLLVAVVVVILLLTTARGAARFYTSYLWFEEVGFTSVFRGVLVTKILLAVTFCLIFLAVILTSLTVADRYAPAELPPDHPDELVVRYRDVIAPYARWLRVGVAIVFALFAGVGTNAQWNNFDLYRYSVSFHQTDPEYHRDIGFYVFRLPFIKFLLSWSFEAVIVVLLVTAVAQYLNGGIRFQGESPRVTPAVKTHMSLLLGVLAIIQGINYYYDRLGLVLGTGHIVDGATATSVHANKPADDLLIAIAVIAAVLFLLNIRARGWTLPVVGVVVWALVWVIVGNIYPALYQALRVNPSELTREAPYIQRNIQATLQAYGLTDVRSVPQFDNTATSDSVLSPAQIDGSSPQAAANRQTLANVQLLDPNQVVNTFDKLQSLRTFYSINNLEVDRYQLGSGATSALTETLVGVRELNSQLPGGGGFTTSQLQYTHGYGAAVAPANESGVTATGDPAFSLQNAPPTGVPSLSDTGAQVYYGEGSAAGGFVIADSKQPELNYQESDGTENSTHYTGDGGVPAGNLLRRAAFALSFGNADILLSGQVTASSRVIYNRNVTQRVQKAAPFLKYDADPYSVILGGQIYWILDGYTTTANYPYSQDASTARVSGASGLASRFNYVRNSVKVVVNAYTGHMYFFVIDPSDPIIQVYQHAFPDLFTNIDKADVDIPGITSHWRYPEDLFKVQTNMYGRYHLTNVSAFFNQANAWNISQDAGSGRPDTPNTVSTTGANGQITISVRQLNPSYEVAALPGETQQKFLIIQPFVPVSPNSTRQNLTAVMFASADPGDYGQLTVYETPPGENVDGPELVQSTIVQNEAISTELTYLNQQGSQVLLGEVVAVPIANTLLYVQPLYVQSSNNPVPALKDVIVVYNGNAFHSQNASLDNALCQVTNEPVNAERPFAAYCDTAAANRAQTTTSPTGNSSPSPSTTTTTPPAATTTTTPSTAPTNPGSPITAPSGQTVAELLADAQAAFATADTDLKAGNLAAYQANFKQAQADVAQAAAEEHATTSATTTTTVASTSATSSAATGAPTTTTASRSTSTTGG
jgi:uncharacterized membrane protein (UPF0182 family)